MRLLLLLMVGCDSGTPMTMSGADLSSLPDLSVAASADLSLPPGADLAALSDTQVCQAACATIIACGVTLGQAGCTAACLAEPVTIACVRTSTGTCNAIALCHYQSRRATTCGGSGGYPSGSSTCKVAADCITACNAANSGLACDCPCWGNLDPAKAINILINDLCPAAKCATCREATYNGPLCNTCSAANCGPELGQCQAS